jgi:hypothetical protein
MPDLHEPLPDRAHEMLRQSVAAAIDRLEEQVQRINDAFLLLSVTADFSQATLSTAQAGRKSIADVQATGGGLAKQVAAINTRSRRRYRMVRRHRPGRHRRPAGTRGSYDYERWRPRRSPREPVGVAVWTKYFWKDAAERAVATAAQSAVAVLGADGLNLFDVNALDVLSVAGLAGLLAVLKAIAASRLNDPQSASLVDLPGKHAADR